MKITNCRIVLVDRVIERGTLEYDGDTIVSIKEGYDSSAAMDCSGNTVAPGCIDLHTHGSGGVDFMDGTESDMRTAARGLARYGTTAALATTLTSSDDELFSFFTNLSTVMEKRGEGEARMLGAHLEGPYFNMEQKGAQNPRYILPPRKEHYTRILEKGGNLIKRWSVAPELDGAMEFIRDVTRCGIIVSGGHTKADFRTVGKAVENGMTMLTHFYSAMSSMTKKQSWKILGCTEAGLYYDDLYVELIGDGCHIPEDLLRFIFKIKREDRIIGITDSMRAAGMEKGESILGPKDNGTAVVIEDGVAKLSDRSCFAGSVATGIRMVKTFSLLAGRSADSVFRILSYNPAKLLGVDNELGSLDVGKKADFIIYDDAFNLKNVFIGGVRVL